MRCHDHFPVRRPVPVSACEFQPPPELFRNRAFVPTPFVPSPSETPAGLSRHFDMVLGGGVPSRPESMSAVLWGDLPRSPLVPRRPGEVTHNRRNNSPCPTLGLVSPFAGHRPSAGNHGQR